MGIILNLVINYNQILTLIIILIIIIIIILIWNQIKDFNYMDKLIILVIH